MAEGKQDPMTLLAQVLANQQQQLDRLTTLMESSLQGRETQDKKEVQIEVKKPTIVELASLMDTFVYEPRNGLTFDAWYGRYVTVFKSEAEHLGDNGKVQLALMKLDTSCNKLYRDSIAPKDTDQLSFTETVEQLKALFTPKESVFRKRFNTLQVRRDQGEEVTAFAGRVNRLAEDFELGAFGVEQLKCLLFVLGFDGAQDKEIRTRLLNMMETNEKVTLKEMVNDASRLTSVKADVILGAPSSPFPAVHKVKATPHGRKHRQSKSGNTSKAPSTEDPPKVRSPCWGCGRMHLYKDCEYRTRTCPDCDRQGHKSGYCAAFRVGNKSKVVKLVQSADNDRRVVNSETARKFLSPTINGKQIRFQLDSGADVSIITHKTWLALGSPQLTPPSCRAKDAQGNPMPMVGEIQVTVKLQTKCIQGRCFVAETDENLFGIEWIEAMGLWDTAPSVYCRQVQVPDMAMSQAVKELEEMKSEFATVFSSSMGRCTLVTAKLHLLPGAKDVFRKRRPVPFHSVGPVTEELDRLEKQGIITPISQSAYAAPIVVVQKANGTIRICGDYSTGLNANLQDHEYPIPTPEDIFASLSGCKWFSQVDLSDAYMQIPVDQQSAELLTLSTIKGLYSFNRLCPGVKPAAGIFQQAMETILAGVQYVIVYFDDILIATPTISTHIATVREVLKRLNDCNMRVRLPKCKFFQKEVKYLGVWVNEEGQRPDPSKLEVISSIPAPKNAPQLRSYLGALTFYSRFIKSMSTIRAPLNDLLKKGVDYHWDKDCQRSFEEFKKILASDLLLTHYDPRLPIVVAADASQTGIGGIGYHTYPDGSMKAFLHVSRRLLPAETRYSQIELEALAIVWTVTKLHKYLFGRKFTLFTDHRPLLAIFGSNKGVPTHVANRIRRWAITLMAYNFSIHHIRTEDFGHADVLSRLIAEQREDQQEDMVVAEVRINQLFVKQIETAMPVSFADIERETKMDQVLPIVMKYVNNGWPAPREIQNHPQPVAVFHRHRESLSIINGALTYLDRTVIPLSLQAKILQNLHQSHPGCSRMKSLARGYVYWPGIDGDIERLVRTCKGCQLAAKMPARVEPISWPEPEGPWERVHIDFAGPVGGAQYFIIVDAYTKWPEVFRMSSTSAAATVETLREVCSRFGSMRTLVSDNGPQFTSAEFAAFCEGEDIKHIRTPPYHPQSNGQVERFVDTFKRGMRKQGASTSKDLQLFLQRYRATPNASAHGNKSPAELMLGRRMRLPLDAVRPTNTHEASKGTVKRKSLQAGHRVHLRLSRGHEWIAGTIVERLGKVMFIVLTDDGRLQRVHCNQLRPLHQTQDVLDDSIYEGPPSPPSPEPPVTRQRKNHRAVTRDSPPLLRPRKR